jgi:hypothetical protein
MQGQKRNQPGNRSVSDLSPQELNNIIPGARHFAVWLLPSEEDTVLLGEIIRDLAAQFDAPLFRPHLTLYQGVEFEEDRLAETLDSLASSLGPIDLKIRAIASSEVFYRCIFIDLIQQAMLIKISRAILLSLQHQEPYALEPHVSLLYKELSQEERTNGLSRFQFPGKTITFHAIQVVRPARQSNGWRDSTDWELDPPMTMGAS